MRPLARPGAAQIHEPPTELPSQLSEVHMNNRSRSHQQFVNGRPFGVNRGRRWPQQHDEADIVLITDPHTAVDPDEDVDIDEDLFLDDGDD